MIKPWPFGIQLSAVAPAKLTCMHGAVMTYTASFVIPFARIIVCLQVDHFPAAFREHYLSSC